MLSTKAWASITATARVGALRVALWWLADADVDWRLLAHAGQALAEALDGTADMIRTSGR